MDGFCGTSYKSRMRKRLLPGLAGILTAYCVALEAILLAWGPLPAVAGSATDFFAVICSDATSLAGRSGEPSDDRLPDCLKCLAGACAMAGLPPERVPSPGIAQIAVVSRLAPQRDDGARVALGYSPHCPRAPPVPV